jgi:hypothetical protein
MKKKILIDKILMQSEEVAAAATTTTKHYITLFNKAYIYIKHFLFFFSNFIYNKHYNKEKEFFFHHIKTHINARFN